MFGGCSSLGRAVVGRGGKTSCKNMSATVFAFSSYRKKHVMNRKNMFMAQGLVLRILQELVRSGEVPLSPQNLEFQIRPKVTFWVCLRNCADYDQENLGELHGQLLIARPFPISPVGQCHLDEFPTKLRTYFPKKTFLIGTKQRAELSVISTAFYAPVKTQDLAPRNRYTTALTLFPRKGIACS